MPMAKQRLINPRFRKLDIEAVNTIAKWQYSETDDGLYMKPYQDSYLANPNNMKGPGECDGYGVYFENKLFGLFEFKFVDNALEIGCALEPMVKGKGYGKDFVLAGISFGISNYQYTGTRVLLDVDVSNIAARKVYEKAGFIAEKNNEETIWMYKEV
jgi:[ribosomal protein S18]-alanine N-acetyltransferase